MVEQHRTRRMSALISSRLMANMGQGPSQSQYHRIRLAKRLALAWTLVALWIAVGGFVFAELEGPREAEELKQLDGEINQTIKRVGQRSSGRPTWC